jgi:hypothetical protein
MSKWDWCRDFPRKGIHKWSFPCSVRDFLFFIGLENGLFLLLCHSFCVQCFFCTVVEKCPKHIKVKWFPVLCDHNSAKGFAFCVSVRLIVVKGNFTIRINLQGWGGGGLVPGGKWALMPAQDSCKPTTPPPPPPHPIQNQRECPHPHGR